MTRGKLSAGLALVAVLGRAGLAGLGGLAAASQAHAEEAPAPELDAPSRLGASDGLGDRMLAAQRGRPAIRKQAPEARAASPPALKAPDPSPAAGPERRAAPGRPTEATTVEWLRRFGRVDVDSRRRP